MAQLIDHEGRLAVDMGWITSWSSPQRERLLYVGKASAEQYHGLVGKEVKFTHNTGYVNTPDRSYVIQTDNEEEWTRVVIVEQVKKPRDGKYYTHKWHSGRWEKRSK